MRILTKGTTNGKTYAKPMVTPATTYAKRTDSHTPPRASTSAGSIPRLPTRIVSKSMVRRKQGLVTKGDVD